MISLCKFMETTPYQELFKRIQPKAWAYIQGQYSAPQRWLLLMEPFIYFFMAIGLLSTGINALTMLSATALLFFYYVRIGFLGHDIIHGQLFDRKAKSTSAIVWLVCSLGQGISELWWKEKHNEHHRAPNGVESTEHDFHLVDTDVDTMPFLLWDAKFYRASDYQSAWKQWFLKHQDKLVWPLLAIIRPLWARHSLFHGKLSDGIPQKLGVLIHYFGMMSLLVFMSGWMGLLVFAVALGMGSLVIGIFSLSSHAGMDTYEVSGTKHPFERALISTRNVQANPFIFWLSGGLSHQIEHHLYANLPRYALRKMSPLIEQECKALGIPYLTHGTLDAIRYLPSSLRSVKEQIQPVK